LALTMSTYTSEPGTRLAGRYRLVDQVNAGSGWTMWKAIDETLARPVTVLTFAPGFPRVAEVVTAARAASRLNEPRLAQVFDVEDSSDGAYAVMEWVAGDTLADLLSSDGPLDAGRACILAGDAARALASAHGAGLAHLRLTPACLHWTRTGGVKITGLGIDAALAGSGITGAAAQDPAVTDTQGLASLLYAALTGYWPGEEETSLPAAPQADGAPCTPRQVSPDVSPAIDAVICRALLQRTARHEPPILTPSTFADALAAVAPPVPLPEPAQAAWQADGPAATAGYPGNPNDPGSWTLPAPGQGGPRYRGQPGQRRSPAARGVIGLVVALVLVAIAATAWVISTSLHSGTTASTGSQSPSSTGGSITSTAPSVVLKPVGDGTYNADEPKNDEDTSRVKNAIDGNPSTYWATEWYEGNPVFGGLKKGTGLILDMGKAVKLSSVQVTFSSQCCTNADIYIGNTSTVSQSAFSTYTKVASGSNVSGEHTYTITSPAEGQYVVIWLTSLPLADSSLTSAPSGSYQGLIFEVTVHGTPATSAG
jgi:NedA-like, galactose-binding domain